MREVTLCCIFISDWWRLVQRNRQVFGYGCTSSSRQVLLLPPNGCTPFGLLERATRHRGGLLNTDYEYSVQVYEDEICHICSAAGWLSRPPKASVQRYRNTDDLIPHEPDPLLGGSSPELPTILILHKRLLFSPEAGPSRYGPHRSHFQ